ncbi:MAG: Alpha-D-kanosaminyltransferase [bacterium ADurb.Bin212]|nr:MAG: Alpha-D-kanosaminyltransferase [bacterium ADurb.Bin212]
MSNQQSKIKLVQIIADSDLSGGPRHVLGLLSSINRSKFECFLICPNGNLSREAKEISRLEVINIEMSSKFDLVAMSSINKILSQIQSQNNPFGPMIVHTHGTRAGFLGRMSLPKGVLSVYTEHRWDADYHLENRINEWLQLYWLKRLNQKTHLIIAVSNSVRDFLINRKLAPDARIRVIHNGIDLQNAKSKMQKAKNSKGNHFIIGNVGNLNHQKGHEYLIEAMPEILEHYPHAMLEIIGEGEERKNLESKIQDLKLERHVTLLGKQVDPMSFMAKWDLFVLPSVAETFGIVVLEAMSQKLPVVATQVGGVPDIIKHNKNGILVSPHSPESIAEATIELLSRPAKMEQLARNASDRVKDFDWKKIVSKVEREYLELI